MAAPMIPEGYIAFPEISHVLHTEGASWQVPATELDGVLVAYPEDRHRTNAALASFLGKKLVSDTVKAAGISSRDGRLVWLPAAVWRLVLSYPFVCTAVEAAFHGRSIQVPNQFMRGPGIFHYPVLMKRELALAFGARQPPAPPQLRPESFEYPQKTVTPVPEKPAAPNPTESKVGRPVEHDWEAFWIEVAVRMGLNGLEDVTRRELQTYMQIWCAEHSTNPPDDSTIRRKLAKLYARARKT